MKELSLLNTKSFPACEKWHIALTLPEETAFLTLMADASPLVELKAEGGFLSVSVLFTGRDTPVILTAPGCKKGDPILINCQGFRISLWVNGALIDEDWPIGQVSFETVTRTFASEGFQDALFIDSPILPTKEEPDVLRTFRGAEGFKPLGHNTHAGDCMPFSHDGVFHLFYLFDRRGHRSKWRLGAHQWAHLTSRDLVTWEEHPLAVSVDDQMEGSICTGSTVFCDGKFYAFYAVRTSDGSPAQMGFSVSEDGIHFKKEKESFALSDRYWSPSARDPKVFAGEDGLFHMLITTSLMENGRPGRGCLAHLTSKDLKEWTEAGEAVVLSIQDQPECSDYFTLNGLYYLVYSNFGVAHYFHSPSPFGPWEAPEDNVIVDLDYRVPKRADWKDGRVIFAGFRLDEDVDYGGTVHFYEAFQNPDGSLSFGKVAEMEDYQ